MRKKLSLPAVILLASFAAFDAAAESALSEADQTYLNEIVGKDGNKREVKALLKARLAAVEAQAKQRLEFINKETQLYKDFSAKKQQEHEVFEDRLHRQLVVAAESLAASGPEHRQQILSDLERLHANITRSFLESQRKQVEEFFSEREKRWREHQAQQAAELGAMEPPAPAAPPPAASSEAKEPASQPRVRPVKRPTPAKDPARR